MRGIQLRGFGTAMPSCGDSSEAQISVVIDRTPEPVLVRHYGLRITNYGLLTTEYDLGSATIARGQDILPGNPADGFEPNKETR